MDKKRILICGCKAKFWTFAIAYAQIVDNILALVWTVGELYLKSWDVPIKLGAMSQFINLDKVGKVSPIITILIGLTMGLILLGGASKRDSVYLGGWIIWMAILLILTFIMYTVTILTCNLTSWETGFHILVFCLALVIYGFSMWMVRLYMDEIKEARSKLGPIGALPEDFP